MKPLPVLLVGLVALAGCVERKMFIKTEPEGATVWINRPEEASGKTPYEQEFAQHGTFAVRLEKEGYLPLETEAPIHTPWYSYPVLDLITELLLPFTIEDHHVFTYRLEPRPEPGSWEQEEADVVRKREEVLERADEFRREVLDSTGGTDP
jgi:hypothetical protein